MRLPGERLLTAVDRLDDPGADVGSNDLVTLAGELRGERQTDLAECDDGDFTGSLLVE